MKYVPGLMVGQLSGKAGSTVASRGRFGSYFRTRNVPTNPDTVPQQTARQYLTAASREWGQVLSPSERAAWDSWALLLPKTDSLGVTYYQSGFDLFCAYATSTSIYNGSFLAYPTTPVDPAPADLATFALTASASGGTVSVAYTVTPLATGVKLIVEATAPMSPGRKYIRKSEYRQVFISAAAAASPANIASAYIARFGDLTGTAGKVINYRVFTINPEGTRSTLFSDQATIAA